MRVPIVVPDLGSGEETLRVSAWFVDEGDWIVAGDLVVEVLIPGITFDIASESTGRLVEISAITEAAIHEGDVLGWIEGASNENASIDSPAP